MQEILFKAKTVDTGEWVYGYYVRLPDAAGSVHMMHVPANNPDERNKVFYIDPETLEQFTGLPDQNGDKIFGGDILESYMFGKRFISVVRYSATQTMFIADLKFIQVGLGDILSEYGIKIIGNIHDNPELIGGTS